MQSQTKQSDKEYDDINDDSTIDSSSPSWSDIWSTPSRKSFFLIDKEISSNITKSKSSLHRKWRKKSMQVKKKKYKVPPRSVQEAFACDADVEDSDSTIDMDKTTDVTAETSGTSSLSFESTSKKDYNFEEVMQEVMVTPPRGIYSLPFTEYSPLSSDTFHSSSSSSGSPDCNKSQSGKTSSMWYSEQRQCSTRKFPSILSAIPLPQSSHLPFKETIVDVDKQIRFATKVNKLLLDMGRVISCIQSKARVARIGIISLYRTFNSNAKIRCMVFIMLYSTSILLFTALKLNQIQPHRSGEGIMFRKLHEFKSYKPRVSFSYNRKLRSNFRPKQRLLVFEDSIERVAMRQTLGGLQPVYNLAHKEHTLGKVKNNRGNGLGTIDANMYETQVSAVNAEITRPRVIHLAGEDDNNRNRPGVRELNLYLTSFSDNTQLYGIRDSDDPALSKMEPFIQDENNECVPIADWQSAYHHSCNDMHSLDLIHEDEGEVQLFGKKGFWRQAWRVDMLTPGSKTEVFILKTPKFDMNFEQAYYEHDRVDSEAMERLTFSPHVINIYGFCGRSVLSEWANGPRIGTLTDKARKRPLHRLKIARDIATGISHVHFGRGDINATFVHLDVNPANVVVVGNTLKVNDFNIGIMLKRNITSNANCGFPAQYPNPQWRSPEEANNAQNLTEKVDVFSMGHIFFRMICGHEPWNKLETRGKPSSTLLLKKVKAGIIPRIPDSVLKTSDPEEKAILDAMLACYTVNPDERPSSRDIAEFLDQELTKLAQKVV